jgi:hypothetical protein
MEAGFEYVRYNQKDYGSNLSKAQVVAKARKVV